MIDQKNRRPGFAVLTAACFALAAIGGCDRVSEKPQASTTPTAHTAEAGSDDTERPTPDASSTDARSTGGDTTVAKRTTTGRKSVESASVEFVDPQMPNEAYRDRFLSMQQNAGVEFPDNANARSRVMIRGGERLHAGTVYTNDPVDFTFHLRNAGDGDLVINRISTSCGCTTVQTGLINVPFAPGEDLPPLVAQYKPQSPGDSSKVVSVFTNDPVNPVVRLHVGANLVSLAKAVPEDIRPGELRAGRRHVVTFDVFSYDAEARIASIEAPKLEKLVDFKFLDPQPVEDTQSEYAVRLPVQIIFPADLADTKISSPLTINVTATPPGGSQPVASPVVARLVATLAGDLRFARPFARVTLSDYGAPFSFNSNLTTLTGRDFEIQRVVAFDRRTQQEIPLEFTAEKIENAKVPTYRMSFSGTGPERGALAGEVLVYTTLENEPPAKMTFSGFVPPQRANPERDSGGATDPQENRRLREGMTRSRGSN